MNRLDDTDAHRPDPAFAGHMEWQIRTALRRRSRFDEPASLARRWPKRLAASLALVGAVVMGAGAVLGAQQVRKSREAELLVGRQRVQRELATTRLQFLEQERAEAERLAAAGVLSAGDREALQSRVMQCRTDLQRALLDAEEVALTGRTADDGIAAPTVRGRDFVAERLRLEVQVAHASLAARAVELERVERLHQAGMLSGPQLDAARRGIVAAQQDVERIRRKLELRSSFLAGDVTAERAELLALRLELESRLATRKLDLQAAHEALERARQLGDHGYAPASEVRAAEQAVIEAQGAVELAELELGVLDERLGR